MKALTRWWLYIREWWFMIKWIFKHSLEFTFAHRKAPDERKQAEIITLGEHAWKKQLED